MAHVIYQIQGEDHAAFFERGKIEFVEFGAHFSLDYAKAMRVGAILAPYYFYPTKQTDYFHPS